MAKAQKGISNSLEKELFHSGKFGTRRERVRTKYFRKDNSWKKGG